MAKSKGKSLIGLDIGSRWIKAVEVASTETGLSVINFVQSELTPQRGINETLQEMIATADFKTKKIVTAVSGRSVIVRYITMPRMSDEELKSALKYEISKYIPFEAEEVITDCVRLEDVGPGGTEQAGGGAEAEVASTPASSNDEMKVLLVAVKKDAIEEQITLLENSGFWPTIIDVDSFALGNSHELYRTLGKLQEESDQVVALIDVGASKTNINIILGRDSYFTREIYIAGNDFTEALTKKMGLDPAEAEALKREPELKTDEVKEITSAVLEDLCHEIHLSFDYFENQFEKPIDTIYLSGGGSRLVGLDEMFERMFEKKPICWDPTEFLEITSEKFTPSDLKSYSTQLAVAVGLASRIRDEE